MIKPQNSIPLSSFILQIVVILRIIRHRNEVFLLLVQAAYRFDNLLYLNNITAQYNRMQLFDSDIFVSVSAQYTLSYHVPAYGAVILMDRSYDGIQFFLAVHLSEYEMFRNDVIADLFLLALDRNGFQFSVFEEGLYHLFSVIILPLLLLIHLFRF